MRIPTYQEVTEEILAATPAHAEYIRMPMARFMEFCAHNAVKCLHEEGLAKVVYDCVMMGYVRGVAEERARGKKDKEKEEARF